MAVEQRERMRIEIRHAEIADPAFVLFLAHPLRDRGRIDARVEAVQRQHFDMIAAQRGQRLVQRGAQMLDRQIVVGHAARIAGTARHDDADLGDQPVSFAQPGPKRECRADQRIGGVAAVNVGQIQRVDSEIERGFQQIRDFRRRQSRAPFAEAHRAEDGG